eukprot:scaffold6550_cov74-Cyclotella_meneghiniana.AAC.1
MKDQGLDVEWVNVRCLRTLIDTKTGKERICGSIEKALLGCGKVCSQCGVRSDKIKKTSVYFDILDEK